MIEYRILFDNETRKGEVQLIQNDGQKVESYPIKHIHIAQSQTLDYIKNEEGVIVSAAPAGPVMTTFTMTGDSVAEDE